jgi:aminopeptidase C
MLVNLVNKYGVIPKSTFPESSSSEAALLMNKFLRTKVYLFIEKIYVCLLFSSYVDMLKKSLN